MDIRDQFDNEKVVSPLCTKQLLVTRPILLNTDSNNNKFTI